MMADVNRRVLRFGDGLFIVDAYKDDKHIITLEANDDGKVLVISTNELRELHNAIEGAIAFAVPAFDDGTTALARERDAALAVLADVQSYMNGDEPNSVLVRIWKRIKAFQHPAPAESEDAR